MTLEFLLIALIWLAGAVIRVLTQNHYLDVIGGKVVQRTKGVARENLRAVGDALVNKRRQRLQRGPCFRLCQGGLPASRHAFQVPR